MGYGLEENGQEIILNADNAEKCQIKWFEYKRSDLQKYIMAKIG